MSHSLYLKTFYWLRPFKVIPRYFKALLNCLGCFCFLMYFSLELLFLNDNLVHNKSSKVTFSCSKPVIKTLGKGVK